VNGSEILQQDRFNLIWEFKSQFGFSCDQLSYSLNGGSNVTTNCINTSFVPAFGVNNITLYANDTEGRLGSSFVEFTHHFANYTINVYDEMTGELYNTTTMSLFVFCENETISITLNGSAVEGYTIDCQFEEIKLEINDSSGSHWRTLSPTVYTGELIFYMINMSVDAFTGQEWDIYDVSSDFFGGLMRVVKIVIGSGEKTMIEKIIDAERKALLYLINGERYCMSVISSNRAQTRELGCIDGDTDTEKKVIISEIDYEQDQPLTFKDVFVSFQWDKDSAFIRGIYNDTLGQTTSVMFTVYN
ncbi:unnamed protein product, partial [marine sediment metagenome]